MAVGQASERRGDPGQVLTLATWGTGQHPEHSSSHQAPLGDKLWKPRCEPCLAIVHPQEQESDPAVLSSPVPGPWPADRAHPVISVGSTATQQRTCLCTSPGRRCFCLGLPRQGQVLNKDPHATCSSSPKQAAATAGTSSHVKSVHVTIAVSVMERT